MLQEGKLPRAWMAPSIWEVCRCPPPEKVALIFSTMSTKISSRAWPPVREVSRIDLITPVGPLPTPGNACALAFCARTSEGPTG